MADERSSKLSGEVESSAELEFTVSDGIARIHLNRPRRRNALSIALCGQLALHWDEIDRRDDIRAVVLTAASCGTFCAGMDLKEAAQVRADTGQDILDLIEDPFHQRMRKVSCPIIVALTGHFLAGGFMLALNADLRVAANGTEGGVTEVQRGRGSPWLVPALWMLPQPILLEMALTGDPVSAERLHAHGFINYIEADEAAVLTRAYALATRIRDNAPLSVRAAKASLAAGASLGCEAGIVEATRLHQAVYASEDAREGPRAFAEKRPPVWQGR